MIAFLLAAPPSALLAQEVEMAPAPKYSESGFNGGAYNDGAYHSGKYHSGAYHEEAYHDSKWQEDIQKRDLWYENRPNKPKRDALGPDGLGPAVGPSVSAR
jgi:hypothetical protein